MPSINIPRCSLCSQAKMGQCWSSKWWQLLLTLLQSVTVIVDFVNSNSRSVSQFCGLKAVMSDHMCTALKGPRSHPWCRVCVYLDLARIFLLLRFSLSQQQQQLPQWRQQQKILHYRTLKQSSAVQPCTGAIPGEHLHANKSLIKWLQVIAIARNLRFLFGQSLTCVSLGHQPLIS